jgi:hypothetical protein
MDGVTLVMMRLQWLKQTLRAHHVPWMSHDCIDLAACVYKTFNSNFNKHICMCK